MQHSHNRFKRFLALYSSSNQHYIPLYTMSSATATEQATTSLYDSLLPNYITLEGILLETAVLANTLILESTADYERLRLYNVVLVASSPIASINFLPLRLATIGEAMDFDYIGSSNHAFFLLRGAPGQHLTVPMPDSLATAARHLRYLWHQAASSSCQRLGRS